MLDITRTTWILLLVQACATIAGVALASYFWARQFARPMRALRYAMVELGNGHTGTRLVEKRNDELGLLFDAFNTMASQLQNSDQTRKAIDQHPTQSTSTSTSTSMSTAESARP
jgi:nitrate/nitrite-specific signal transduction histidine kinase